MKRTALALLALSFSTAALAADFPADALARVDTLAEKYVGLAETVPQDAYEWRPAEGVRSVSEVFLHVAGANFGLTRFFGTPPPEGMDLRGLQSSTTDRDEIVAKLRDSFAHLRGAVAKLSEAEAGGAQKMFGRDTTTEGAVWTALEHLSEHLGQSIAYARTNDVTPPWSGGD